MTTLVLIRHAQTDSNLAGPHPRMSGWTDIPVNATGWAQLERLRTRLAHEAPFAALYTSPLTRAQQTAAMITATSGIAAQLEPDLREIFCGDVDGQAIEVVRREHRVAWARNEQQLDDDFRWPGGESYRELRSRCLRAIAAIAARHPNARIAVVTHAGAITQVLGAIHGYAPARWEPFRAGNTSLTEIRWRDGRGELIRFDDHRHLQDE